MTNTFKIENLDCRFGEVTTNDCTEIMLMMTASANQDFNTLKELNKAILDLACSKLEVKIKDEFVKLQYKENLSLYFKNKFIAKDVLTLFMEREITPFLQL